MICPNSIFIIGSSSPTEFAGEGEVDIRSNALEVHVSRLRSRMAHAEGVLIRTVRGRGYRIEATKTETS